MSDGNMSVEPDVERGLVVIEIGEQEYELFPDETELWLSVLREDLSSGKADELLMQMGNESGVTKSTYENVQDVMAAAEDAVETVRQHEGGETNEL